jgi:hypothetical protein
MAATARVHGLTMVTRNERDFAHFDVAVLNPSNRECRSALRRSIHASSGGSRKKPVEQTEHCRLRMSRFLAGSQSKAISLESSAP